jgi:hypothetical protein
VRVETTLFGQAVCANGNQDFGETDVDCGGQTSCARCDDGKACKHDWDCSSALCLAPPGEPGALRCAAPTCDDLRKDGDEADFDCGGSCKRCIGASRQVPDDCASGVCDGSACAPPVMAAVSSG